MSQNNQSLADGMADCALNMRPAVSVSADDAIM